MENRPPEAKNLSSGSGHRDPSKLGYTDDEKKMIYPTKPDECCGGILQLGIHYDEGIRC